MNNTQYLGQRNTNSPPINGILLQIQENSKVETQCYYTQ